MSARFNIYWIPGTAEWAEPPDPNEPVIDPVAYAQQVDRAAKLKEHLKGLAEVHEGRTNNLPHIPGAPMLEERPHRISVAGGVSVSFPIYCGEALITAQPALVPSKDEPQGIMWAEKLPDVLEEREPPRENIEKGYRCELCRRFDLEQGQDWLNEETHKFQEGKTDQMHKDIMRLVGSGSANATMPRSEDMGLCVERSAIVPKHFPGCEKFVARKTWG